MKNGNDVFCGRMQCEHWTYIRNTVVCHFLVVKDRQDKPVWINIYYGDIAGLHKDMAALKERGGGAVDRGFGNLVSRSNELVQSFLDDMHMNFTKDEPTARLVGSFDFDAAGEREKELSAQIRHEPEQDDGWGY